jgi:hypothetical protein
MKNMNDIRAMLCEEIEALRNKETTPANVNAIVNATGKILSTIKLEMEYAKLAGKEPKMDFIQLTEAATVSRAPQNGKADVVAQRK